MILAKISSKGQVTLPKRIRQALNVKPGEKVLFEIKENRVLLRRPTATTAKELAGCLRQYARPAKSFREIREIVEKEVARAAAQEG